MNEWRYWLALAKASGLGPRRFGMLVDTYGSPEAVYGRSAQEIAGVIHVPASVAAGILRSLPGPAEDREIDAVLGSNGRLITTTSDEYPPLLKTIYDPPPFLYARGKSLGDIGRGGPCGRRFPWISVVGSRKSTPYGKSVARRISHELCASGCVVVSGMAAGVDSYAHRGALDAGGETVAVLGTGIDVAYPRENARLLDEICRSGAVLSEYGMGEGPAPWHFPMRNRIISGVCEAVVVVEAGESSGALITADLALEQGREVMAVPGPARAPLSRGTNRLIKTGAALVEDAEDVLAAIGFHYGPVTEQPPVPAGIDAAGEAVLILLDNGPLTIDRICEGAGLPASVVAPVLTELELRGMVERMAGAVYCKRR